jgi:hypothetical protein
LQVDERIKGLDLGKEGFVEEERNPQLSRDCLLSSSSLHVTEFISICTENYSSAVVRSEETRTVTSTTNVKQLGPELHLRFSQGSTVRSITLAACFMLVYCFGYPLTLKMEATYSSKPSVVFQGTARRYTPKDGTLIIS